jgi:hypothetical protein
MHFVGDNKSYANNNGKKLNQTVKECYPPLRYFGNLMCPLNFVRSGYNDKRTLVKKLPTYA